MAPVAVAAQRLSLTFRREIPFSAYRFPRAFAIERRRAEDLPVGDGAIDSSGKGESYGSNELLGGTR
jgi:hypothetical protein